MSDSVDMVSALGGELITYYPHNGTAKAFKAVVERRPTQVDAGPAGSYPSNQLELLIPCDAVDGVERIKERFDTVSFKRRPQDAEATMFTVTKVVQEDNGMVASDGGMFRVMVQA